MKKLLTFIFAAAVGLSLVTTSASADVTKGQKIIVKQLKKLCAKTIDKFDGNKLAKMHTQAEWKAIFESGKLNDEIAKICPKVKKPLKKKYAKHVYDFLYHYASDSGVVASC